MPRRCGGSTGYVETCGLLVSQIDEEYANPLTTEHQGEMAMQVSLILSIMSIKPSIARLYVIYDVEVY